MKNLIKKIKLWLYKKCKPMKFEYLDNSDCITMIQATLDDYKYFGNCYVYLSEADYRITVCGENIKYLVYFEVSEICDNMQLGYPFLYNYIVSKVSRGIK